MSSEAGFKLWMLINYYLLWFPLFLLYADVHFDIFRTR